MAGGRTFVGVTPTGGGAGTGRAFVGTTSKPGAGSNGRAFVGTGAAAANPAGGGGLLGDLKGLGHYVASKAGLAAHDIHAIPGGIVQVGKLLGEGTAAALTGNQKALNKNAKQITALGKGQVTSAATALEHPLRDPFQTITTVLPLTHGVGNVAARVGAASDVARTGGGVADVAKAAVAKPTIAPRLLTIGDKGEQVPLHPSKTVTGRAVQGVYDKVIQKAIDTKPEGKIASHATRRAGGSLDETARYQQRMREAPAGALNQAAKNLTSKVSPAKGRLNQAALELTSVNTAPEDAAAYHLAQAAKGVEPARNRVVAKLYQTVADKGMLTKNEQGDVIVNAEDHPGLAHADVALAKVQGRGDEILARYGIRSPEELQKAANAPGRYRAGATYETPTPGKNGKPSQALIAARARVERIGTLVDRAEVKQPLDNLMPNYLGGRGDTARVAGLRGAHSLAKEDLQRLEDAAARRVKPTGVIGGETARPARGHVSYASTEKNAPTSPAAASTGSVVGEAKPPITSYANTGHNIEHGLVPKDITGNASRHYRQILRFVNTTERRNAAIKLGTTVSRSKRDVLVKVPGEDHAKIPAAIEEALGRSKPTTDEINGLNAALDAYRETLVPGLADKFAEDASHPVGTTAAEAAAARGLDAPEGYKFVDRNLLGDLGNARVGPRGKIARTVDNINADVTAATVYFKVGHAGTRVLTNAATNIIQGSANPVHAVKGYLLWKDLGHEDRLRALAAAGQHGFESMPHEGVSRQARFAAKGASWWAKHADAAFRFNSIAYEARKAGFDTPAKFKTLLDHLENGGEGLTPKARALVDAVAKNANREGIAYDRLNATERNYITRGIWFYPWVKGATVFAGRTLTEHPVKAGLLGAAGVQGRETQQAELGDLPSYEGGLFKVGGANAAGNPLVADFSTFSPFATPADLLDVAAGKGKLADQFNPALAGAGSLAYKLNPYGQPTASPLTDSLATTIAPAWPVQLAQAFLARNKDQSRKMFPKNPALGGTQDTLLRALLGPGTPRRINLAAAASAAAREKTGR